VSSSSNGHKNGSPHRRQIFRALEAKSLRHRSFSARISDFLTNWSSTPLFLFLNVTLFLVWILINTRVLPGIEPFDPFPFGLLTMAVSLEAIVLSIFVLISQNRSAQIATLRDELNLRVNLIAEQEVTKSLEILSQMRKKMGITDPDPILDEMLQDVNANDLEQLILQQIARADQLIDKTQLSKGDFSQNLNNLVKKTK
jgi:uncharacterized membrane protein